jgi:hypothetical protein
MSSVVSGPTRPAALGALAVVAVLAGAAGASAAADGPDTTTAVSPRTVLAAPDRSPVDFPGVAKARAGEPLPDGYAAVARDVRITRGREIAYAALRMACPKGKTWRTGAVSGDISVSVLDRAVSNKRSVLVMASLEPRDTALGQTAAGTVYALCR